MRVLVSLCFWVVAGYTCVTVGLALVRCGSLWRAPAALLLDAAVLPHALLLALSLEMYVWQMAFNLAQLKCPDKAAVLLEPGLLPELASWWPLDICGSVLEAAIAKVRHRGFKAPPQLQSSLQCSRQTFGALTPTMCPCCRCGRDGR